MADEIIPIKLVIEEPDKDPQVWRFEQKIIKIGRGARKGIDIALEDPSIARLHATIQIQGIDKAHVMDMGSSGTRLNGKPIGARGKLTSGAELELGRTIITVTLGEEARLPEPFEEEVEGAAPFGTEGEPGGEVTGAPPGEAGQLPPGEGYDIAPAGGALPSDPNSFAGGQPTTRSEGIPPSPFAAPSAGFAGPPSPAPSAGATPAPSPHGTPAPAGFGASFGGAPPTSPGPLTAPIGTPAPPSGFGSSTSMPFGGPPGGTDSAFAPMGFAAPRPGTPPPGFAGTPPPPSASGTFGAPGLKAPSSSSGVFGSPGSGAFTPVTSSGVFGTTPNEGAFATAPVSSYGLPSPFPPASSGPTDISFRNASSLQVVLEVANRLGREYWTEPEGDW